MFRPYRTKDSSDYNSVTVFLPRGLAKNCTKYRWSTGRMKTPYMMNKQNVSIHLKAWLIILVFTFPEAAFSATLTVTAGSGDTFWSNASGSISTKWENNGSNSDNTYYGYRWNVSDRISDANACFRGDKKGYIAQSGPIAAGITITPGAIMHFTAGRFNNTIYNTNVGVSKGSATLVANGTMTNLVNSRSERDQVLCTANLSGASTYYNSPVETSLTGGMVSIYVDNTAVPGTYPIPALYLAVDKAGAATTKITNEGTLVILPPTSCTVNTPAVVEFGDITPKMVGNTGVLVANTLGIACMIAPGNTANVSWTVKPKTQAGDKFTLPLISTAGGIAGDIRGFMGSTAAVDAGCIDKTTSVRMDNTPALLGTFNQTETQSYPLIWSLCPRVDAKPGPAKAIATIDINW